MAAMYPVAIRFLGENGSSMIGTVRFLLALCVVAAHTRGYRFDLYPDTGLYAVGAFFVISGYLMPATLEANYGGRATPYLANRFLRIFPLYWLVLGLALIALQRLPEWSEQYDFGLQPIIQNFLLLGLNQWPNDTRYIGPAWTLDIELQWYLLVPLLMLLGRRTLILIGAILSVASFFIQDRSFFGWAWLFFAGMAFYFYAPRSRLFQSKSAVDRLLGDIAYPLFIVHQLVIQATGLRLEFWATMSSNMALAIAAASLLHVAMGKHLNALRGRLRRGKIISGENPFSLKSSG